MLVSPILVVIAATGAIYIFKAELERLIYLDLLFVTPSTAHAPYDDQLDAARRVVPREYHAEKVIIPADPTRATTVGFEAEMGPYREVFVDPHTAVVRGQLGPDSFFRVVLDIHRNLFVGTPGRAVVELTTCWTIVLLATGLYLWWPRRREKVRGVFVPRLRAKPYVLLRDLHSLAGFYVLPVALTIACTGLIYTLVWGTGYRMAADRTGAYAIYTPPGSGSPPEAPPLGLDEAVAIARRDYPGEDLEVILSREPGRDLLVIARNESGPSLRGGVVLDRASGKVRSRVDPGTPARARLVGELELSLHVGSVLGMATKVLWLVACLALMALPVTGLLMWWKRRPAGRPGLPRRPDVRLPRWLAGVIVGLGLLLPTVGASLIIILAGEWAVGRLRRTHAGIREAPPST